MNPLTQAEFRLVDEDREQVAWEKIHTLALALTGDTPSVEALIAIDYAIHQAAKLPREQRDVARALLDMVAHGWIRTGESATSAAINASSPY